MPFIACAALILALTLNAYAAFDKPVIKRWIGKDGGIEPTKNSGMIQSKKKFGSCQLLVEWAPPNNVEGDGRPGR